MLRVETVLTGPQGSPYLNTMHFDAPDSQLGADDAAGAAALFWSDVDALMGASCAWQVGPVVEVVNPVNGQTTGLWNVTVQAGAGSASDPVPFASQVTVQLRTGVFVAGREIRGRIFIPCLTETNLVGGRVASAAVTSINVAAATLIGDSAALGIWSRVNGTITNVSSASANPNLSVLRSRRD